MSSRTRALAASLLAVLVLLALLALYPAPAHAASAEALPIPWLDEIVAGLKAALVKVLQDLLKGIGVVLWALLKLCGAVGLLGDNFSTLFGDVITEAIDAVIAGDIQVVIRGSLTVSLGLLGLSLLAKPFWPELQLVNAQRAVVWGIAIQAYLLNAPAIYAELETWRVDLADQVASAVSSGSVPGCGGDTVHTILCIAGTNEVEVLDPSIQALPDSLPPYGGTETVHDLYNHCVYNPPTYYGDAGCDPDDPQGDPWEVLGYAQDALGTQFLSLILGLLILAYGVLQLALGLAAGMMFVLFPVAAIFSFYTPLESFPAGVIRNYISIFLKSVVLLTLAAVVVRLFTVASGNLLSLAAVGVVDLLLCGIMAKEALGSLLSSVSFVGNSVSNLGANVGLTGGGGGGASAYPSPESRMAASMIGGPLAQTLMGAPNPYLGGAGGGLTGAIAGAPGRAMSAVGGSARAAISAAMGAGTGGVGFLVGAAAAARGASFGSLALGSNAASILGGPTAGRGFTAGAGLSMLRRATQGRGSATGPGPRPGQRISPRPTPSGRSTSSPATTGGATAPAVGAIQGILGEQSADPSASSGHSLSGWSPTRAGQIREAATKLGAAPQGVRRSAYDLMQAGHDTAQRWEGQGQSPFLEGGLPDPRFVDEVIQQAPAAARAFTVGQAKAGIPAGQELHLVDAIALGAASPIPQDTTPAPAPPPAAAPQPEPRSATPEDPTYDPALFEQLRTWRRERAGQEGKKAFHVFTDATLQRIAAAQPQTPDELRAVKGVGPKKLEQFGKAVLDVTRNKPEEGDDA